MHDHSSRSADDRAIRAGDQRWFAMGTAAGTAHLVIFGGITVLWRVAELPDAMNAVARSVFVLAMALLPVMLIAEIVLLVRSPRAWLILLVLGHLVCTLYLAWLVLNAHW